MVGSNLHLVPMERLPRSFALPSRLLQAFPDCQIVKSDTSTG